MNFFNSIELLMFLTTSSWFQFFLHVFRIPMKLKTTDENSNLNPNIKSYFITNRFNAILT